MEKQAYPLKVLWSPDVYLRNCPSLLIMNMSIHYVMSFWFKILKLGFSSVFTKHTFPRMVKTFPSYHELY